MELARKFKTKEEIPAGFLPYCSERDGLWHLNLEDPEDKGRLAEFRDHNIDLKKQVAEGKRPHLARLCDFASLRLR
jgi:hypothetical protein